MVYVERDIRLLRSPDGTLRHRCQCALTSFVDGAMCSMRRESVDDKERERMLTMNFGIYINIYLIFFCVGCGHSRYLDALPDAGCCCTQAQRVPQGLSQRPPHRKGTITLLSVIY